MFVLFRTITYATVFVSFLLIYLPARVLAWSALRAQRRLKRRRLSG
jgi:hypothetical protein